MNKYFRKLAVLALFVLALHAVTFAQDFAPRLRAHIPFPFYAGSKVLPPGDYTVAVNRQISNVAIFEDGRHIGTFLLGSPNQGTTNGLALLTFHRNSEGVYALQKIQAPDIGVSFTTVKASSLLTDERRPDDTQVLVGSLGR